ncbi:DUF2919 family protein [Pseudoalteromonas pernae]|uniref:DUF2919 family protein n=1 Tax=Pseudoalteromonas pernae TaxID=3118054 RepID=UPI003241D128
MSKKIQQGLRALPFSKFDNDGWLKTPLLVYLNLALLAKGLVLFVAALASRQAGAKVLQTLYPDQHDLYVAIGFSIVPAMLIALFTIGEIKDNAALKKLLLVLCCGLWVYQVMDLSISLSHIYKPLESTNFFALCMHLGALIWLMCSFHARAFLTQTAQGHKLTPDIEEQDSEKAPN